MTFHKEGVDKWFYMYKKTALIEFNIVTFSCRYMRKCINCIRYQNKNKDKMHTSL